MLFQKLKIKEEKWYLILKTIEDVETYMKVDASLIFQALRALPESYTKSHLEGSREIVLHTMLQCETYLLKADEKLSPFKTAGRLIQNKVEGMLSMIAKGNSVLVQEGGGYCSYEGFFETWNFEVVDEIESDKPYFPTNIEPQETELLFLENSERVPVQFFNDVWKQVVERNWKYGKDVYKLQGLKLKDPAFMVAMITKAKRIAFESQLADDAQINNLFKLFSTLPQKHIIIRTPYKDKLSNHSLFEKCSNIHTIEFI